jgi:hypothetical protein
MAGKLTGSFYQPSFNEDDDVSSSNKLHTTKKTNVSTLHASRMSISTRIPLGLGSWSIPVHYVDPLLLFEPVEESWVQALGEYVSSLSCKAIDIARGHLSIDHLQGLLTPICLQKLDLFVRILESAPHGSPLGVERHIDNSVSFPPIIPTRIELYALSPDSIESVVSIMVVGQQYQTSLKVQVQGSTWVCSFLDVG